MKNIFYILMATVLLSCSPKELPTVFEINDQGVILKLSHQSTKDEMATYSKKCSEIGFTVDFSGSEFFDNGKLRRLNLGVSTPNGHSGRTSADGVILQFQYYGFVWKREGSFLIGNVDNPEK